MLTDEAFPVQTPDEENNLNSRAAQPPSKSQLKREASALQALGARLVALKPAQLEPIPLPAELREAVDEARRMSRHGARRRQLQLIGKLMRQVDPEPIREALARLDAGHAEAKGHHHYLEHLCEALVKGDQDELTRFLAHHPDVDRQRLRQLIRSAIRERELSQPPRFRRQLFRYLRAVVKSN